MIQRYHVILSPRSLSDLFDIHTFIATDSPQNAAEVIERLLVAIEHLDVVPRRYPVYQGKRQPTEAVRRMPVLPFFVYYRIKEPNRSVEIITIRHGHRRQPRSI
jgi:plasmid stabilization system protein ParE